LLEASNSNGPFAISKTFAVRWEVQQDKEGNARNSDRGRTLDDKQPPPAAETMGTLKTTRDCTGKQTTEGTGENGG
jgi:hypothetical protein